jgi:hypothetical protein
MRSELMRGQMTWKSEGGIDKVLYLRAQPHDPWKCYKEFPQYYKPDLGGRSPGYATFLTLLRQGWQMVHT